MGRKLGRGNSIGHILLAIDMPTIEADFLTAHSSSLSHSCHGFTKVDNECKSARSLDLVVTSRHDGAPKCAEDLYQSHRH